MIQLKRIYDKTRRDDGYRVLVDRIWPRGIAKDAAAIDEWLKAPAPSAALRRDFHGGALEWGTFRRHYLSELREHREPLRALARRSQVGTVTLVFAARDTEHNNAVVLAQYLRMLGGR